MKYTNVNWNLYRSFIAAYETKHLPTAAEILDVCRSAVGHNLREFSNQLGVKLFTATRKGIEPTSEAIAIYPLVKKASDYLFEVEQSVKEFNNDSKAIIRMAVPSTLASLYFKQYLLEFCKIYPKVKFEFFNKTGFELLSQNKIDFIIDIDNRFKSFDFKTVSLGNLNGVFVASKEFLKINGLTQNITKDELIKMPIIVDRDFLGDLCNTSNLNIEPFIVTSTTEAAYAMAKGSMGIVHYHSELMENTNDNNMVILNVEDLETPKTKIVCGYNNRSITKAARAFIEGLVQHCSK